MPLVKVKPTSPGRRALVKVVTPELHKGDPFWALTRQQSKMNGRNHHGTITMRHKGGGHKHHYRIVDWRRNKDGIPATVARLEYDPNRSAHLALLLYKDGERRYVIAAKGVAVGAQLMSGPEAPIKPGNTLPLRNIPIGTEVHCVRMLPGKGAQLARSAGGRRRGVGRGGPRTAHRGRARAGSGARGLVHAAAAALGRDPQGACRLPCHHRRSGERRAQPRVDRQGGTQALARRAPDGARGGDEPDRSS